MLNALKWHGPARLSAGPWQLQSPAICVPPGPCLRLQKANQAATGVMFYESEAMERRAVNYGVGGELSHSELPIWDDEVFVASRSF